MPQERQKKVQKREYSGSDRLQTYEETIDIDCHPAPSCAIFKMMESLHEHTCDSLQAFCYANVNKAFNRNGVIADEEI